MLKKFLYGILLLITIMNITPVKAASSYKMSLISEDSFSHTITMKLRVNSLTNFDSGIYGLEGRVLYNTEKLQLISYETIDSFDLRFDPDISNKFVLYSDTFVDSGTNLLTLVFKNVGLADQESTTISIDNLLASDGENDIEGTSVSKTITYNQPDYIKGDMNKNGEIDFADVIIALRKYLNIEISTAEDKVIADMNENNEIDFADVISILKKYMKID